MSQALVKTVEQQMCDAIVQALKEMSDFFWVRSQSYANPYLVRLA